METNLNQTEVKDNSQKKKIIIISVAVIFVLLLAILLTYFITLKVMEKKSLNTAKNTSANAASEQSEAKVNADFPIEKNVDMTSDIIKKGWIKWQELENAGDLGLTNKKLFDGCVPGKCDLAGDEGKGSSGIKYFKVGTVTLGKYAGSEIFVVSSGIYEGLSQRVIFRFLRKNNVITFLASEKYGIDEYMKDQIATNFSKDASQKFFNDKIYIEELDFPENLQGENERQQFAKVNYTETFFTDAKLKKVFVHPQFGQVWMTDAVKALNENVTPYEPNSYITEEGQKSYYDIFTRRGFYLKAPDGTTKVYKLIPDIFKADNGNDARYKILEATWNDETKNDKEFELNPSGCGGGAYVYEETLTVNPETDLVVVGRTSKGDSLYGYRDASLAGFSKLYNETYWVKSGETKLSVEEFLKKHPKVFWKDPFGRVLAFYSMEFISPAECGKPVIYLYPEKSTEVSVKVEPGKGLSFTDPEYKSGWLVKAEADGRLTNLTDGKIYPYLFWEGAGDTYYEMSKLGFTVANNNLETFFNEKLAKLGLIQKEINDFKEFWIPKMREAGKSYYFITFLSKRFIDQLAPLTVNPQPETVIRVLMDWKGLDAYQKFQEPFIQTPKRKGFTVVEWGGMLK